MELPALLAAELLETPEWALDDDWPETLEELSDPEKIEDAEELSKSLLLAARLLELDESSCEDDGGSSLELDELVSEELDPLEDEESELLQTLLDELPDPDDGQHPWPKARTSHRPLSAKRFATPNVPAGTAELDSHPHTPLVDVPEEDWQGQRSAQTIPTASCTVNVKSTGHQRPPWYRTSRASAEPQRVRPVRSENRQWSS